MKEPVPSSTPTNRLRELDGLRGLALGGILVVNIHVFHAPYAHYSAFYGAFTGLEATVVDAVVNFFSGKFLWLFALLFGMGLSLQHRSRGAGFLPYHVGRMVVLLAFGASHIAFFWFGDILALYAVLGILATPLLVASWRFTLGLGLALLLLATPAYYVGAVLLDWPLLNHPPPASLDQFLHTFSQGSYGEILHLRAREYWSFVPETAVWYAPKTLGLFCLGMALERAGFLNWLRRHSRVALVIGFGLLLAGIVWSQTKLLLFGQFDLEATPLARPALIALNLLLESALAGSYLLLFLRWTQAFPGFSRLWEPAGRMALTNYLSQSVVCTSLFYGYGLGWYGTLTPSLLMLLSAGILGFNLLASHWYLKRFRQGPLEVIWRRLASRL